MFIQSPAYNASLESEDRIMNTDHFEEILPHADVPVDPGAEATPCCEVRFYSGETTIILLPFSELKLRLSALVGVIDNTGVVS